MAASKDSHTHTHTAGNDFPGMGTEGINNKVNFIL